MRDDAAVGQDHKARRESSGKSLRTVAKAMGISAPYLSDLERGRRGWSDKLSEKFNAALQA